MAPLSGSSDVYDDTAVVGPANGLLESHKNNDCGNVTAEEDVNRIRNASGNSIQSFITRNEFKVEKLPTFHHLHVSDLSHIACFI